MKEIFEPVRVLASFEGTSLQDFRVRPLQGENTDRVDGGLRDGTGFVIWMFVSCLGFRYWDLGFSEQGRPTWTT